MNILEFKNVNKYFGDYLASNDVSFAVKEGAIFGLLGPNGAGKTTIIRQITNIYMPDEGEIVLFGSQVSPQHQNRIAYLPEERGLYKKIKVIDQLKYFGRLKGLSASEAERRAREWLIRMEAADWADKKIQELSKGMSQKVQFIATILHDPEFLILDEPFSGFDPVNVEMLKNIILELRDNGKTIILSTHIMDQVEQLCDEIVLINKGKVVLEGPIRDIKKSFGRNNLVIEYEGNGEIFDTLENVEIVDKNIGKIEIKVQSEDQAQEILKLMIQNELKVLQFSMEEPRLNEIFISTVGRENLEVEQIAELTQ